MNIPSCLDPKKKDVSNTPIGLDLNETSNDLNSENDKMETQVINFFNINDTKIPFEISQKMTSEDKNIIISNHERTGKIFFTLSKENHQEVVNNWYKVYNKS